MQLSYGPAIGLLDIYSREMKTHVYVEASAWVLKAAWLITVKRGNNPDTLRQVSDEAGTSIPWNTSQQYRRGKHCCPQPEWITSQLCRARSRPPTGTYCMSSFIPHSRNVTNYRGVEQIGDCLGLRRGGGRREEGVLPTGWRGGTASWPRRGQCPSRSHCWRNLGRWYVGPPYILKTAGESAILKTNGLI